MEEARREGRKEGRKGEAKWTYLKRMGQMIIDDHVRCNTDQ